MDLSRPTITDTKLLDLFEIKARPHAGLFLWIIRPKSSVFGRSVDLLEIVDHPLGRLGNLG